MAIHSNVKIGLQQPAIKARDLTTRMDKSIFKIVYNPFTDILEVWDNNGSVITMCGDVDLPVTVNKNGNIRLLRKVFRGH